MPYGIVWLIFSSGETEQCRVTNMRFVLGLNHIVNEPSRPEISIMPIPVSLIEEKLCMTQVSVGIAFINPIARFDDTV